MNGLAGCYVSTIGKLNEYFDLTGKVLNGKMVERRSYVRGDSYRDSATHDEGRHMAA